MGMLIGTGTGACRIRALYIGVRSQPVWSVVQVTYNTVMNMTGSSETQYHGWTAWPIDQNGAFAAPEITGTAREVFDGFPGLLYWKPVLNDRYLYEFVSAVTTEGEEAIEVTAKPHRLSSSRTEKAHRVLRGYVGVQGRARLFYTAGEEEA